MPHVAMFYHHKNEHQLIRVSKVRNVVTAICLHLFRTLSRTIQTRAPKQNIITNFPLLNRSGSERNCLGEHLMEVFYFLVDQNL